MTSHFCHKLSEGSVSATGTIDIDQSLKANGVIYSFVLNVTSGSYGASPAGVVKVEHANAPMLRLGTPAYVTLGTFANLTADGCYLLLNENLTTISPWSRVRLNVTDMTDVTSFDYELWGSCDLRF